VRDRFQVVGIPAGVDAAAVMEFLARWDGAAQELPAEPVGPDLGRDLAHHVGQEQFPTGLAA